MNIFFLSLIPLYCARYHCDKHVVKMILESVEILYAAHWLLRPKNNTDWINSAPKNQSGNHGYKLTHAKHPSIKWTAEGRKNYEWLCEMAGYLCDEFHTRYGDKKHAAEVHLDWLTKNVPPFTNENWTTPKLAMFQECKDYAAEHKLSPVEAYQYYYVYAKIPFMSYKNLEIPPFLKDHFTEEQNYTNIGLKHPISIDLYKCCLRNEEMKEETKLAYGLTTQKKEDLMRKAVKSQLEPPSRWHGSMYNGKKITNSIKKILGKECTEEFTPISKPVVKKVKKEEVKIEEEQSESGENNKIEVKKETKVSIKKESKKKAKPAAKRGRKPKSKEASEELPSEEEILSDDEISSEEDDFEPAIKKRKTAVAHIKVSKSKVDSDEDFIPSTKRKKRSS